jgi:ABC-type sugar transport system ATPase subunit
VWKRYGATVALRGVSIALRAATVHALIGENGAGKSTLAGILGGGVSFDSGTMRIGGAQQRLNGRRSALRQGIATVSQELTLAPSLSVMDNVMLGVAPGRLGVPSDREARRWYTQLANILSLEVGPNVQVSRLARSDQQKIEILRALARDARCLILDEPTTSLSGSDAAHLLEVIGRLSDRGMSVLYVSHDLDDVRAIADEVTVLRDGQVVLSDQIQNTRRRDMVEAMLGRPLEAAFPPRRHVSDDQDVLLQVRDLSRRNGFGPLSFSVRSDEIVAITGLLGSAGRDLARSIAGELRPDSGSIMLRQSAWRPRTYRDALRGGVALLPESRADEGLLLRRPLIENLLLEGPKPARLGFIPRRSEERSIATRLLHDYGVVGGGNGSGPPTELSGGNQQKVMLAKSLYSKPTVLVAVQPTTGVDVGAKASIYSLLVGWVGGGTGLLVITTEAQEAFWLADRVLITSRGQIASEVITRQCSYEEFQSALAGPDIDEERK